jgi:hypothetical protein
MNAKLALTDVCDVIVSVWSGALVLDLRLKTKRWKIGPSNVDVGNLQDDCR